MAGKRAGLTWALVAFLSLSNVESKSFRLQERILGGVRAAKGQFPHMVSLINRQNQFHICGGAIIDNYHIVTSAYCAKPYASYPELLNVFLGAWNFREKVQSAVAAVTIHPEFNETTKQHDIALIRMQEEITFTEFVKPIALPTEDFPNESGIKVAVSGFGMWFVSILTLNFYGFFFTSAQTKSVRRCSLNRVL